MTRPLTVLIVGGYGTFGGRLARLLADCDGLTLLIAGRSLERAQEFCLREANARAGDGLRGARLAAVHFDRDRLVERELRSLAPDIVVDASGPFQAYGGYRLVEACIACGIHYLDLADSTDFVCGIERFDERARARGVFVLSGVSSFPVLTAAVVRLLSADMTRVDEISGGIAPSPFANVGLNVIRAIAGYAGKPVLLRDRGGERVGYSLTETRRYTIAAPGRLPVRSIEFSLVDVPDLRVLPMLWPQCRSVWMGAGPVPAIWHRVLRGLAWLVRLRVLPSLSFLAPLMYRAINAFAWGEHRGGMFVRIVGSALEQEAHDSTAMRTPASDSLGEGSVDAGSLEARPVASATVIERSWHLVAELDAGPFIPSMAAEAIVRRCLADRAPAPGARAATRELEVADYEPLLARRAIHFGIRDDTLDSSPDVALYRRVLGGAWDRLPPTLRAMHSVKTSLLARGRADVTRGRGWLASLVASLIGFPRAGADVPVEVRFDVARAFGADPASTAARVRDLATDARIVPRETWRRSFAGRTFSSEQFAGHGRFDRLVCERFGPLTLALALVVEPAAESLAPTGTDAGPRGNAASNPPLTRLRLIVRGWTFLGVPLPRALAPQCDAHESEHDGRFHFDVALRHRWTGLIVHYRGWLVPA
jgi:uncharacterized protein DUF4166/saccharopine dehydrogenase-like protein